MRFVLAFIFIVIPCICFADQLVGKVIKVTDGDTLNILTLENEILKVRLSGIDAPEKDQAFGNRSKQALADIVHSKMVTVEYNKLDKYQRFVGKVIFNDQDVNLRQIKLGLAWHYKKYENEQDIDDRSVYANEEYLAQKEKVGLWVDKNPVAPWDFRNQQRHSK